MTLKEFNSIMEQIDGLLNLIKTVQKQRHKKYALETLIPYGVGCDVFTLKIMSLVQKHAPHLEWKAIYLLKQNATVNDVLELKSHLLVYLITKNDITQCVNKWVYGIFDSQKEWDFYKKFCIKHSHFSEKAAERKYEMTGWVDERPYVKESYTGIGVIRKVVCPYCGAEEDMTDICEW